MTQQLCDRCGRDITDRKSGVLDGCDDADTERGGVYEVQLDLCMTCYREFRRWLAGWVKSAALTRATRKAGKR